MVTWIAFSVMCCQDYPGGSAAASLARVFLGDASIWLPATFVSCSDIGDQRSFRREAEGHTNDCVGIAGIDVDAVKGSAEVLEDFSTGH